MIKRQGSSIDETILRDQLLPKTWTCPHCRTRNTTDAAANDILVENFKVIRQYRRCSYLHIWKLVLNAPSRYAHLGRSAGEG